MAQDEYYETGDSPRMRRRKSIITFALVLLLLFFAIWYALSYVRADVASGTQTTAVTQSPTCGMSPKEVEVNVYNATNRDGLAGRVANQLKERGFTVKTVANDPKKAKVEGIGQLRYGSDGRKGAKLVGLHTGDVRMIQDARKRTTVDLVIGPGFKKLSAKGSVKTC